jgi:hypothetical protein
VLARVVYGAAMLLCLAVIVGSIPIDLTLFQTICAGDSCAASQQLSASSAQALQQLGLSVSAYGVLGLGLTVLITCIWVGVALVILWRKSDEWRALLVALMLVYLGANTVVSPAQNVPSFWQLPANLVGYVSFLLIFLAFLLFPDGRFRPRWTRWLFVVWAVALWFGYFTIFPQALLPLFILLWAILLLSLLIVQIYRYRRVSTPVQRQQTKWVVLGVGVVLVFEIAEAVLGVLFPSLSQSGSLADLLIGYSIFLVPILVPLSIGLAILRYRLWDVDALINKTLVYGSLTALLGALYAGLILGLESLIGLFGGPSAQNPLALVVSTLVIAALFLPVRKRLQAFIDRRFYRRKYDAEKTLAAFSATLRNEVDLEQIRAQVLSVVQETMQPAHVSLWLRQPERHPTDHAHRLEPHGQVPTEQGLGQGQ